MLNDPFQNPKDSTNHRITPRNFERILKRVLDPYQISKNQARILNPGKISNDPFQKPKDPTNLWITAANVERILKRIFKE